MPNVLEQQNQQNSAELLDYLMRRFGASVLKLAYYHTRDRHAAEDIVQETFYRVYKHLDSFRRDSSYYTWIYRIAVNLCADHNKSAYKRRVLLGRGMETPGVPDARLFEEAEGGEVFSGVMELPLKYRTVMALHYFDDMPVKDVARVLKLSENAVRTRLFRGREMLKKIIEGLSYE